MQCLAHEIISCHTKNIVNIPGYIYAGWEHFKRPLNWADNWTGGDMCNITGNEMWVHGSGTWYLRKVGDRTTLAEY